MPARTTTISIVGAAILAVPTAAVAHPGHETPPSSDFQKVTLDDFPGEPIALAVLPDRRVLHTARSGEVRIHEPSTGRNVLAAKIPVYLHDEEGVQGVAIDPDFVRNKWVYIYYSPIYSYGASAAWPELGTGGIGPMGGPAYDYDRHLRSRVKWPASFDGLPLFAEWTRDYVKAFHLDRRNQVTQIDPVLPEIVFDNLMDLEFGPDGALYVLEYGDGYFNENPDAQLARIDYAPFNRTPIPKATATPTGGQAPLTVAFSSAGTTDPDGDALSYAWDFDADGRVDSRAPDASWTYTENGNYRPVLKVTDSTGRSASAEVILPIGTLAPVVTFVTPTADQPFHFGDTVTYEVAVTDDAPVDCSRVTVTYILGHDQHGHPLSTSSGCTGSITTFLDPGHAGSDNLTAVFVASSTDTGTPPQTGSATVVLTPAD